MAVKSTIINIPTEGMGDVRIRKGMIQIHSFDDGQAATARQRLRSGGTEPEPTDSEED